MGQKKNAEAIRRKRGWIFLCVFVILIALGIVVKRVYHHPEFIMFFHLPAAVFLVMAGYDLPAQLRRRYHRDCKRLAEHL
jgi:hypothetical protein